MALVKGLASKKEGGIKNDKARLQVAPEIPYFLLLNPQILKLLSTMSETQKCQEAVIGCLANPEDYKVFFGSLKSGIENFEEVAKKKVSNVLFFLSFVTNISMLVMGKGPKPNEGEEGSKWKQRKLSKADVLFDLFTEKGKLKMQVREWSEFFGQIDEGLLPADSAVKKRLEKLKKVFN